MNTSVKSMVIYIIYDFFRFLATGASYSDLHFAFLLGESTVSNLTKEVMDVLWQKLYPLHMPPPNEKSLYDFAQEFYDTWGMPHCCGAIDCRHIRIKKPPHSGSLYYNYKNFYSIVLQAIVDARARFICIDIGGYGSQHDSNTLRNSTFYKAVATGQIKFPQEDELPNSPLILPYYLVGDGAYPIGENMMKPFSGKNLTPDERRFNARLSRARVTSECAFGKMCQKWRIFYKTIEQLPSTADLIVKATCILHNVIIDRGVDDEPVTPECIAGSSEVFVRSCFKENFDFVSGYETEVRTELTKYLIEN